MPADRFLRDPAQYGHEDVWCMSTSSPARPILGYTDTETVKLDFDQTNLPDVVFWARRTMRWFKLGGFVILESSRNNYHVIFDRTVSWSENVAIMAWIAIMTKHRKLTGWVLLQCRTQGFTLRVSPKGENRPCALFVVQGHRTRRSGRSFTIVR